jgi:CRISPR-associated protein Csm1
VFKWDEWLGIEDIAVIDKEIRNYLNPEAAPNLLGIFPFVKELLNQVEISYSRSFVRNLLLTADLQEQMIKKIKDKPLEQQRDIRYYLHLPKVAYTLARLPDNIRNARSFEPVRTSLKSPYNAPYFRVIATWLELLNRS